MLLSRRKEVPTHFYEERETLQKDSRFIGRTSASSSSPDFALPAKISSFLVKDFIDQFYKIYKGDVINFPNLIYEIC